MHVPVNCAAILQVFFSSNDGGIPSDPMGVCLWPCNFLPRTKMPAGVPHKRHVRYILYFHTL